MGSKFNKNYILKTESQCKEEMNNCLGKCYNTFIKPIPRLADLYPKISAAVGGIVGAIAIAKMGIVAVAAIAGKILAAVALFTLVALTGVAAKMLEFYSYCAAYCGVKYLLCKQ